MKLDGTCFDCGGFGKLWFGWDIVGYPGGCKECTHIYYCLNDVEW